MENIKDLKLIIGPLTDDEGIEVKKWCNSQSLDTPFSNRKHAKFIKFTYEDTSQSNNLEIYSKCYSNYEKLTYQQWYDRFIKKSKVLPKLWCIKSTGKEMYEKYLEPFLREKEYYSPEWDGKDYYYHVNSKDILAFYSKRANYTEISFEDFKELILEKDVKQNKEEIMKEKVVFTVEGSEALKKAYIEETGYTSYSPYSTRENIFPYLEGSRKCFAGWNTHKEKIHFILPQDWDKAIEAAKEYFKEKPKFKIKDWVCVIKAEDGAKGAENRIGVITNEDGQSGLSNEYKLGINVKIGNTVWTIGRDLSSVELRLATPEEIKFVQTKTLVLGDKKIKVEISKGEIWAENKKLSIELVNEALTLMSLDTALHNNNTGWAITFPSIKIGCTVLSLDEVKLIKKTYEELND